MSVDLKKTNKNETLLQHSPSEVHLEAFNLVLSLGELSHLNESSLEGFSENKTKQNLS